MNRQSKRFVETCADCGATIGTGTTDPADFRTPEFRAWSESHQLVRVTRESRKAGLCAQCFEKKESEKE